MLYFCLQVWQETEFSRYYCSNSGSIGWPHQQKVWVKSGPAQVSGEYKTFIPITCTLILHLHPAMQIIDEADRMIDSMHQAWLSQVVKATYSGESGQEGSSIFSRSEPACITAARLIGPLFLCWSAAFVMLKLLYFQCHDEMSHFKTWSPFFFYIIRLGQNLNAQQN